MIILGYACINNYLSKKFNIITNRTCRLKTAEEKGIEYLELLSLSNLSDLLKIIQWNGENNILFYRITSNLFPHITNDKLLDKSHVNNFQKLVYPLEKFEKELKRIGDVAKEYKIRLTFHPDLFAVLNSPDSNVIIRTKRDLYMHAKIADLMGLDMNSILILHGGGVYDDKNMAIKRWINNFNELPTYIKQRIVIENDETNYNIEDCIYISESVNIPIVFDVFHYYCYNEMIKKRKLKNLNYVEFQRPIKDILPIVKKTWGNRLMKCHISEQDPNSVFGAHSLLIKIIPKEMLEFGKKNDYYLMCECKGKEECVLHLRKKYTSISL